MTGNGSLLERTNEDPPSPSVSIMTFFDIQSFPNELLHKIIRFLLLADLKNVRLVCRRWRDLLIYYKIKDLKFVPLLSDDSVDFVDWTDLPYDTIRVRDLRQLYGSPNQPPPPPPFTGNLWSGIHAKKFVFEETLMKDLNDTLMKNCNKNQKVVSVSDKNLTQILTQHRHSMEHLVFGHEALWGINNLAAAYGLVMENLRVLEIPNFILCCYELSGWENGINILKEFGKIRLPHLTKLKIDGYFEIEKWQAIRWHFNFFRFLTNFKKSLKSLYFREVMQVKDEDGTFDLDTSILADEACPLSPEEMDELRRDLAEIQLEEFDGTVKTEVTTNGFGSLAYHLLDCQTHLVKLGLESNPTDTPERNAVPFDYFERIGRSIRRNSVTLQNFEVPEVDYMDYGERGADLEETRILWRALAECENLEKVDMTIHWMEEVIVLPWRLQPTLKKLIIAGMLHPKLLGEIQKTFPKLETLQFTSIGWERRFIDDDNNEGEEPLEDEEVHQIFDNLRREFLDQIQKFVDTASSFMGDQTIFDLEERIYDPEIVDKIQNVMVIDQTVAEGVMSIRVIKNGTGK